MSCALILARRSLCRVILVRLSWFPAPMYRGFRRLNRFRHTPPRLFPVSPRAPRRENQAAPGGTAGFCFPGLLPQNECGSPSHKAALGTWEQPSLASVPAECPE